MPLASKPGSRRSRRRAAWRTNSDITDQGHYRQDRHALISYALKGITSLTLGGWNHQNVLSELWVDRSEEGYVLYFPEIHGVDGEIAAAEVTVSIEPFDPQ